MENLSKDILIEIALKLPDINNFCQTSKRINNKVCNNNNFWIRKIYKDFNIIYIENKKYHEKYIKSPARARKYYLEIDSFLKKYTINELLECGLLNNREDLIKIAIYKDATIEIFTFEIFEHLKKLDENILDILLNSQNKSLKLMSDILKLIEKIFLQKQKIVYVLYLYNIILPLSVKYIYSKKIWKAVLSKLENFKIEGIRLSIQELIDLYNQKIDFYKEIVNSK